MTQMQGAAATSIDEYIAAFPPEARTKLEQMRSIIRDTAPQAVDTIAYRMPTFDLHGKHLVHFAGHTSHVGLYPIPRAIDAFKDELAPYKRGKGSVQFRFADPLPADLIRRMVALRVQESDRTYGTEE